LTSHQATLSDCCSSSNCHFQVAIYCYWEFQFSSSDLFGTWCSLLFALTLIYLKFAILAFVDSINWSIDSIHLHVYLFLLFAIIFADQGFLFLILDYWSNFHFIQLSISSLSISFLFPPFLSTYFLTFIWEIELHSDSSH
jgi:hypothetical protein